MLVAIVSKCGDSFLSVSASLNIQLKGLDVRHLGETNLFMFFEMGKKGKKRHNLENIHQ